MMAVRRFSSSDKQLINEQTAFIYAWMGTCSSLSQQAALHYLSFAVMI